MTISFQDYLQKYNITPPKGKCFFQDLLPKFMQKTVGSVYWGNFSQPTAELAFIEAGPDILENRIAFGQTVAKRYGSRLVNKIICGKHGEYDHAEAYVLKNNQVILVWSNYCKDDGQGQSIDHHPDEILLPPIYHKNARTYYILLRTTDGRHRPNYLAFEHWPGAKP